MRSRKFKMCFLKYYSFSCCNRTTFKLWYGTTLTSEPWPRIALSSTHRAKSQIRTVPSSDADANLTSVGAKLKMYHYRANWTRRLCGRIAISDRIETYESPRTGSSLWAWYICTLFMLGCQYLMNPSWSADTSHCSLWDHVIARIAESCAWIEPDKFDENAIYKNQVTLWFFSGSSTFI